MSIISSSSYALFFIVINHKKTHIVSCLQCANEQKNILTAVNNCNIEY